MKFHVYEAKDGWRWWLSAGNNRTLADSGEAYANEADCRSAIAVIQGNASDAAVVLGPSRPGAT